MKIQVYLVVLWSCWIAWLPAAQAESLETLGEAWRKSLMHLGGGRGVSSSFLLVDESGSSQLEWEASRLMLPASCLKLATAVAVIERDGLKQSLLTTLVRQGQHLQLLGNYDPELRAADLEELALEMLPSLPESITIEIPPAEPQPYPPGWVVDDLSSSFAPPISPLTFDHGLEQLSSPMLHPERAAAEVLAKAYRNRGLQVRLAQAGGESWETGSQQVVHASRAVSEILRQGLAESDNLTLECLYRHFGQPRPRPWQNQILRQVDGSGLSRYNLVSTAQLLELLQQCPQVAELLPRAGLEGTLKQRWQSGWLQGRLRAKSGSMSGVSGLVGEFPAKSGRKYRFALLINGFVGPLQPFKQAEEELLATLALRL